MNKLTSTTEASTNPYIHYPLIIHLYITQQNLPAAAAAGASCRSAQTRMRKKEEPVIRTPPYILSLHHTATTTTATSTPTACSEELCQPFETWYTHIHGNTDNNLQPHHKWLLLLTVAVTHLLHNGAHVQLNGPDGRRLFPLGLHKNMHIV